MNDENVKDYQQQEQIIKTIKNRFVTYGYKRIKTSAFEQYDVYSHVKSSIHQRDMVKIIDRTGDVLALRPDATIPITRKIAQDMTNITGERRDRKSTRLNSSHVATSYAVYSLKKKNR